MLDDFAGHSRDPVKELIDREEGKRLLEALLELPYDQREVVTLHLHGGLKFRQIAERRGASINTVQSRYRHALEKLRAILQRGVRR
jgi:RNA polymerase sigma factor (sigma-70 family)